MPMIYHRNCTVCGQEFTCTHDKRRWTCSEECVKKSYKKRQINRHNRIEHTCPQCNKIFNTPASRKRVYCSYACKYLAQSGKNTKPIRTSKIVPCAYCGKPVKWYKSRSVYKQKFCDANCYHAWDSWYKSQPEQQRKLAERCALMRECKTSKVEDNVALWLDQHGIAYERQVSIIHKSMDFKVGNAFIEVQGCYWHGCPHCFILQTPKQRKVMSRDKAKATYCRRRNIPLYVIWEHDVRANNFSVLDPLIPCGA